MAAYLTDASPGSVFAKSDDLVELTTRDRMEITCRACGACAIVSTRKHRSQNFQLDAVDLVVRKGRSDRTAVTACGVFTAGIPAHINLAT